MSVCWQGFNHQPSEMTESGNYWIDHSNSPWVMVIFYITTLPIMYGSIFALVKEDEIHTCSIMRSDETILAGGRIVGYERECPPCSSTGFLKVIFERIFFARSDLASAREGSYFEIKTEQFSRRVRFEKASECYEVQLRPSSSFKRQIKTEVKHEPEQSPPSPTTVVDLRKSSFDCSKSLEESMYLSSVGFSTSLLHSAIRRHSRLQHYSSDREVPRLILHVENHQNPKVELSSYLNVNGEKSEITHVMQIDEKQIAIVVKISLGLLQKLNNKNRLYLTPFAEDKPSLFPEFVAIFSRKIVSENIKKLPNTNSYVLEDSFSFRFKIDKWVVDKIKKFSFVIFNGRILNVKLYKNQKTGEMYFCVELPKENDFIKKEGYQFHLPIKAELKCWAPLSELLRDGFV